MRPPINWRGAAASNWEAGRGGHAPVAVVFHIMQGTLPSTAAWFAQDRAKPSSAHFGVGATGTIDQYVRETDTAYSNGILNAPQLDLIPWIVPARADGINPNSLTISIEMEGRQLGEWGTVGGVDTFRPGTIHQWWTPTAAQYAGVRDLTAWLAATYSLAVDRAHLCRHSDFDHVKKWWCPGLGFPLGRLITDLGGSL